MVPPAPVDPAKTGEKFKTPEFIPLVLDPQGIPLLLSKGFFFDPPVGGWMSARTPSIKKQPGPRAA